MFTIVFTMFTIFTTLSLKFCLLLGCQKTLKISRVQIPEKMKKIYQVQKNYSKIYNYSIDHGKCTGNYRWMLSENELSAFFGFSDTSECMLMFFYASLMWTTPHVSSTYLEQSRLHAWKMQVSPRETQYSMLFEDAVIMSFNIPITSHIIYYSIMWKRL